MTVSSTIEHHKTFEQLAGAVSLQGWKTVEVTLGADEFRIERHGARAICTVMLLPTESAFQANFVFDNMSVNEVAFTIGQADCYQAAPSATKRFSSTNEAAGWLLMSLETLGGSGIPSKNRLACNRMADEIHRIEMQLQQAFAGEAWHGPALMEVLDELKAEEAAAHPIAGAHSAWEIVLHLIGTYELVLRRLDGDGTPLTPAQDWPPVPDVTPSNWQHTLDVLRQANDALRQRVLSFRADALDLPLVPEPAYSAYIQFMGMTQHDLYHAGQIALLKRALRPAQS